MFLGDMEGKVLLGSVHRADDATGRNCATSEDAFSLRDEKLAPSFHGLDRVDGHLDGLGRPHPTLVARVVETGQVSFRRVSPLPLGEASQPEQTVQLRGSTCQARQLGT